MFINLRRNVLWNNYKVSLAKFKKKTELLPAEWIIVLIPLSVKGTETASPVTTVLYKITL